MRIFRNRLICTLAAAAAVSALTAGTAMAQDTFVFSIPLPVTGNSPELHDQSYWRTVYPDQEIGIRVEEYGTDWTAPQAAVSLTGPVEGLPLLETCETGRIYCFTISIANRDGAVFEEMPKIYVNGEEYTPEMSGAMTAAGYVDNLTASVYGRPWYNDGILSVVCEPPKPEPKQEWRNVRGTWYLYENGEMLASCWREVEGEWYFFGKDGTMQTGWVLWNGKRYWMLETGAMARDLWIGGKNYVNKDGEMVIGTTTPDGFLVDENGNYDPSGDNDINGLYQYDHPELVFDSPLSEDVPPAALPEMTVVRVSDSELLVMAAGEEAKSWKKPASEDGSLMNCYTPGGTPWDSEYLEFGPDSLTIHPYYGDVSDRYAYVFRQAW